MGISPVTVATLRAYGHEATHLREEGLHRLPDSDILAKARTEQAIVLTHDLDFGELMAASRAPLPSVIIFRLPDMRPTNVNRHLLSIIVHYADELAQGAILSVTEKRVRVRRLPIR